MTGMMKIDAVWESPTMTFFRIMMENTGSEPSSADTAKWVKWKRDDPSDFTEWYMNRRIKYDTRPTDSDTNVYKIDLI